MSPSYTNESPHGNTFLHIKSDKPCFLLDSGSISGGDTLIPTFSFFFSEFEIAGP